MTTALNYANGPMHLGHMLEEIQADIWVRQQRIMGRTCHFISGSDAHGTPMMIAAEKQHQTPEELLEYFYQSHRQTMQDFLIEHDCYANTHTNYCQQRVLDIYKRIRQHHITQKSITQLYDEKKSMFLSDRMVKGQCPYCLTPDQYGDHCEACGKTYDASDLINPQSVLSGTIPITKKSTHHFFTLSAMKDFLSDWLNQTQIQDSSRNKLKEWFDRGLQDWDISRDAPYFGFRIPQSDQYFYVWMDAPIGYLGIYDQWLDTQGKNQPYRFDPMDNDLRLIHFIGKDILYFHGLFWPAMLHAAKLKTPDALYAHGFLTINGQKMSKSRGTFITADDYLQRLDPECLRYYLASRLNDGIVDIDLQWDGFIEKINSDLIGKIMNLASRTAKILEKHFDNTLTDDNTPCALLNAAINDGPAIADHFNARQFHKAIAMIVSIADQGNQFIAQQAPWQQVKSPDGLHKAHVACSKGMIFFKIVMTYLQAVMPRKAKQTAEFFNLPSLDWHQRNQRLANHRLNSYQHLMTRIDASMIPKHNGN